MGSQFAFFYDIIAIALVVGLFFAGYKKGFAAAIVGLVATIAAFFCASTFSPPISDWLYDEVVEKPLNEAVDSTLSEAMDKVNLGGLSELDFSAVKIGGVSVEDYVPDYAGTSKAVVDLSALDLSGCGITEEMIETLGISPDTDFSAINARTAEFTMAEIEHYGMGKLAVAQFAASSLQKTGWDSVSEYVELVGETLPQLFGDISKEVTLGNVVAIRTVVLNMIDSRESVRSAIVDGIIAPQVKITAQTAAFILIFALVSAVLGILAHLLKIVNKIPIIGGANAVLGGLVGLIEAFITIIIICIVLRFIIALSGGEIMLLNNAVIDHTYIFRYFYNMELLDNILPQ